MGLFIVGTPSICAQEVDTTRIERVSYGKVFPKISGEIIYTTWMEGSPFLYYYAGEVESPRYYLVDARTGTKKEMIRDYDRFIRDYAALTGDTLQRRNLKLFGLRMADNSGKKVIWQSRDRKFMLNVATQELRSMPSTSKKRGIPSGFMSDYSSDSLYRAVGDGNSILVEDVKSGRRSRMVPQEGSLFEYTRLNPMDNTLMPKGFWRGHTYVLFVSSDSLVGKMPLVRSVGTGRPTVRTITMPLPGDRHVKQYDLQVINMDHPDHPSPDISRFKDQELSLSIHKSDRELYFTRTNRPGDCLELCRINFEDNSLDVVIQEKCPPHYNRTLMAHRIIRDGKQILWWSERSGYGAYYLYDRDGKLIRNVTGDGTRVAGKIVSLNEESGVMIYEGYGGEAGVNPSYRYHYITDIDRGGSKVISSSEGQHDLNVSPDMRYAVDKCSRMDLPPVYSVVDLKRPDHAVEFHRMSSALAVAAGWVKPTLLKMKAADHKTDLYGILYLPSDFDPTKKYPVISYVYPGPQTDLMPLDFMVDDNGNQQLAECGFMVLQMPPRGSNPYRGKEWYTYGYGNLRDYPLEDSKMAVEQLAERYPQADLNRVGIYGHSGGGFQTVTSMLTYPDFYKVGIAASGNYDNNIYIQWWGESFHGVKEVKDSISGETNFVSDIPTTMELADNLKGDLLLIVGDQDKNVPPASTLRMADALIQAGKRFDMMILPGMDH